MKTLQGDAARCCARRHPVANQQKSSPQCPRPRAHACAHPHLGSPTIAAGSSASTLFFELFWRFRCTGRRKAPFAAARDRERHREPIRIYEWTRRPPVPLPAKVAVGRRFAVHRPGARLTGAFFRVATKILAVGGRNESARNITPHARTRDARGAAGGYGASPEMLRGVTWTRPALAPRPQPPAFSALASHPAREAPVPRLRGIVTRSTLEGAKSTQFTRTRASCL